MTLKHAVISQSTYTAGLHTVLEPLSLFSVVKDQLLRKRKLEEEAFEICTSERRPSVPFRSEAPLIFCGRLSSLLDKYPIRPLLPLSVFPPPNLKLITRQTISCSPRDRCLALSSCPDGSPVPYSSFLCPLNTVEVAKTATRVAVLRAYLSNVIWGKIPAGYISSL